MTGNQGLAYLKVKCPIDLPSFMCPSCFFNGGTEGCLYPYFKQVILIEAEEIDYGPGIEFVEVK